MLEPQPPTPKLRPGALWLRLAGLLAVGGLSIAIYLLRDRIQSLQQVGYASAFIVNAFASSSVLLPMPGLVYTYALGSLLHPALVGCAAGAGATLGELSGYLAGFSGGALLEDRPAYARMFNLMRSRQSIATLIVFILAFVPNPFFDIAGVTAGIIKMPLARFTAATLAGNIAKSTLTAYAGAMSFAWLQPYLR